LIHQPNRITYTRRTFDRALKALPVTQHQKIWQLYLKFANHAGGETCIRVWRRYLKVQPSHAEQYVTVLLNQKPPRTAEAARVLATIIEDQKFAATGKTLFQYWCQLCELICLHPDGISLPAEDHLVPNSELNAIASRPDCLNVESIMRAGISRWADQVGTLWHSLARWWVLRGELDRARDVYEESLTSVKTVKDFTTLFDAYAKMEEDILSHTMDRSSEAPDVNVLLDDIDIDLRLARFESLMDRRPFLLNDVLIRQNKHNVNHWMERTKLFQENDKIDNLVRCYATAVVAISPHKCDGKFQQLWVDYARVYEDSNDVGGANKIFEEAVKVSFRRVDDLAYVWCQWAEMELRAKRYKNALDILGRATSPRSGGMSIRYNDENISPQKRLFKCVKLWSFYVDLEESVGSYEGTKIAYDRILELKIATPQIIINYASFLEEQNYHEEVLFF
jgi:pre-mRNA-splicing factor SYF1